MDKFDKFLLGVTLASPIIAVAIFIAALIATHVPTPEHNQQFQEWCYSMGPGATIDYDVTGRATHCKVQNPKGFNR